MHGKDGTPIGGDAALALGGPVLSLLTDMSIAATRRKPRNKVRAPREKNPSHGVRWVHWGARRRFMVVPTAVPLHAIAVAVAWLLCSSERRVKVCESANKTGG
eukprot:scaffold34087_cov144-Skeletonema_dohrnii-CCMP3373.AAC.1